MKRGWGWGNPIQSISLIELTPLQRKDSPFHFRHQHGVGNGQFQGRRTKIHPFPPLPPLLNDVAFQTVDVLFRL